MKKLTYSLTATSVIVSLVDRIDDTTTVLEEVTFNTDDIPAELVDGDNAPKSLQSYGLSKLLQDRTSAIKAEDKLEAMAETMALFKDGEWRSRKEGGASKKASIDPIFAQAIANLQGCSVASATIALQDMDAEGRKAIRALDAVKEQIKALREEGENGASDLLSGLL